MRTVLIKKCCVHFCYVKVAVGDCRMTVFAAFPRVIAVVCMAGQTAKPFMHTAGSPVVACSCP